MPEMRANGIPKSYGTPKIVNIRIEWPDEPVVDNPQDDSPFSKPFGFYYQSVDSDKWTTENTYSFKIEAIQAAAGFVGHAILINQWTGDEIQSLRMNSDQCCC